MSVYLRLYTARVKAVYDYMHDSEVCAYELHHTIESAQKAAAANGGYVVKALDLKLEENNGGAN